MTNDELKKAIAEIVLEELKNENSKLVKLMQEHEKRYGSEINENFIEDQVNVLLEYLCIEKKAPVEESELERMRRLI